MAVPTAPAGPSVALKPEPVVPRAVETKAMPQATIKLQPAPAAAARKIGESAASANATNATATTIPTTPAKISSKGKDDVPENLDLSETPDEIEEETAAASGLPLPLVIAVAAFALVAFGIQLWTFLLS
jgi:hypothetical protein